MASAHGGTAGLVLPGGGARGAYQAGAMKAISEILPGKRNPFPVITGASVGAINAAALAAGAEDFATCVRDLETFWRTLHCRDVYRTDFVSIALRGLHWVVAMTPVASLGLPNPRALLDNAPLRDLLHERLDLDGIERAIDNGALRAVAVTASSYSRSRAVTFYQGRDEIEAWTRARRDGVPTTLTINHLVASAALPFVFPAQRIGYDHFGDGSLRLTSPLSPAIHAGADRILVISVRDSAPNPPPGANEDAYPSLGAISGYLLDMIFMDNLDADVERARRIDHTLSLIAPEAQTRTRLRAIEVLTLEPSRDVREIAREHASAMPWTIRMLLKRLRVWGRDWRLPSYLMFEPPYCDALVDLGYRDTLARADEIRAFFAEPAQT